MIRIAPPLALTAAIAACSAPAHAPDPAPTSSIAASMSPSAQSARRPQPEARPTGTHVYKGAAGLVTLRYADPLTPGRDFGGRPLLVAGWRLMWNGDAGPGAGIVSIAEDARPSKGDGSVTEAVRVGMSRDADVVATCGTAGMNAGTAKRLPDRMLGGHRWTVWQGSDAGMSQQIDATDYRTVVDGACYAIDRIAYYVRAAEAKPGLPTQKAAAARIDAVLASIHVGG